MKIKNILLKTAGFLFLAGFVFASNASAATSNTPEGLYSLQIINNLSSSDLVNFKVTNNATATSSLKITRVTGPEKLKTGESGKWVIEAIDNSNNPLTFSAVWGDENEGKGIAKLNSTTSSSSSSKLSSSSNLSSYNQSGAVKHTYYITGDFKPVITVKNDLGEQTSTTTTVKITDANAVSILFPNGWEKWGQGTKQMITFQSNATGSQYWLNLWKGEKEHKFVMSLFAQDGTILTDSSSTTRRSWIVPAEVLPGDDYFIHASVQDKTSYVFKEDWSDAPFSVTGAPVGWATTTGSSSSDTGKGAPKVNTEKCNFYRDLALFSRGVDVACLQNYLVGAGYFPISEPSRGYFGPLTRSSVVKWQIVNNLYPPVGYFGRLSRAKYSNLNQNNYYYSNDSTVSKSILPLSYSTSSDSYSSLSHSSYSSMATSSRYSSYSSSAAYTASSTIAVISPNGGERWYQGSTYYISWLISNLPNDGHEYWVTANLCPTGSDSCLPRQDTGLLKTDARVGNGSGRMRWSIPNNVAKGKYRMLLFLYDKTIHPEGLIISSDYSNSAFDIIDPNTPAEVGTGNATSSSYFSASSAISSYYSNLIQKYSLGFVSNGGGKIFFTNSPASNISGMSYLYKVGDIVTVVAVPNYDYAFIGWSGCDGDSVLQTTYKNLDTCRIIVPAYVKSLTANFSAIVVSKSSSSISPTYTTTSSISANSSSVSTAPTNQASSSVSPATSYSSASPTLVISSSSKSSSVSPAVSQSSSSSQTSSPSLTGSTSSSPTSGNQTYALSINKKGNGKVGLAAYPSLDISGRVFNLTAGTVYALVATPDSGSVFVNWSGCDGGSVIQTTSRTGDTCKIIMSSSNKTVTANFFSLSSSLETDAETAGVLNSINEQLKAIIDRLDALLGR